MRCNHSQGCHSKTGIWFGGSGPPSNSARAVCYERDSSINFLCDNDLFVETVQNARSSLPQLTYLLEVLHELQCRFSFDLLPIYITTNENALADALSRGDLNDFYELMKDTRGLLPSGLVQVQPEILKHIGIMRSLVR